jgi:hypothetical protein
VARLQAREPVGMGRGESTLALIHVEIESPDRATDLKPRLPSYYAHLRDAHGLPLLPIVIYLKVGFDGIGVDAYEERFWELDVLRFRYLYVGLPALDALEYVREENLLGVALSALMRIPSERVIELGQEAYRRLTAAPLTEQQKYLLLECVEAYLPLNDRGRDEFQRLLASEESTEVRAMNKTTFERGMEKGMEKGQIEGLRNVLLRLGTRKFGAPSPEVQSLIRSIDDLARLSELTERVLEAKGWDDLLQQPAS